MVGSSALSAAIVGQFHLPYLLLRSVRRRPRRTHQPVQPQSAARPAGKLVGFVKGFHAGIAKPSRIRKGAIDAGHEGAWLRHGRIWFHGVCGN